MLGCAIYSTIIDCNASRFQRHNNALAVSRQAKAMTQSERIAILETQIDELKRRLDNADLSIISLNSFKNYFIGIATVLGAAGGYFIDRLIK
jgi:cellulose biosynthesis protein BcsQ